MHTSSGDKVVHLKKELEQAALVNNRRFLSGDTACTDSQV